MEFPMMRELALILPPLLSLLAMFGAGSDHGRSKQGWTLGAALLWSVPLCWCMIGFGSHNGVGVVVLPAWLIAVKEFADQSAQNYWVLLIAIVSIALPVMLFCFASKRVRQAKPRTEG